MAKINNLYLLSFAKKPNSTAVPTDSYIEAAQAKPFKFKESTSIYSPTFLINDTSVGAHTTSTAFSYNYAVWEYGTTGSTSKRYYYIDDMIVQTGGEIAVSCHEDVLATYKTDIGGSSCYISRAASDFDGDVIDSFYPALAYNSIESATVMSTNIAASGGFYVIGVNAYGVDNSAAGYCRRGNVYYFTAMTTQECSDLVKEIITINSITARNMNPFDFITGVYYFPYVPETADWGQEIVTIQLTDETGMSFSWQHYYYTKITRVTPMRRLTIDTVTWGTHPQSNRGSYLNKAPYTTRVLRAGMFGDISISDIDFPGQTMKIEVILDACSGYGQLILSNTSNKVIVKKTAMFATEIQLNYNYRMTDVDVITNSLLESQVSASEMNLAATVVDSGISVWSQPLSGGTAFSNVIRAGMEVKNAGANYAISSLGLNTPKIYSSGSNGALIESYVTWTILSTYSHIAVENLAEHGRPLMQTRTINTLSGYVQTLNADIGFRATTEELAVIKGYMDSGFFYE